MEVDEDARGSRAASSATPRPASRCRPTAGRRRGRWRRPAGRRRRAPCRSSRTPRSSAPRRGSSAPGSSRSTCQPRASLIRPPTSRSICGEVSGKRLSARRDRDAERPRDRPGRGRAGSPAAMASTSSGARPARAKFATPNTLDRRSRTAVPVGAVAEHQLDAPHAARAPLARRGPTSPRAGCARAAATNHGRFFPLSAISW